MKAKINNGQLEYFQQPAWLLGDATAYATEHGYKEVVYLEYPNIQINEYTEVSYAETENNIMVNYLVFVNENYEVPEPTPTLEEVVAELIKKLNDKNIIP